MTGTTLVPVASRELLGALNVLKSRFGSKDDREVTGRKGRKFVNRVSCSTSPASSTRLSPSGVINFRPCIDIHKGKVKQIVGSTLRDLPEEGEALNLHEAAAALVTNFESEKPARFFAEMYKEDELQGGHVIILDRSAASQDAAFEALAAYPGGLQIGGGINPDTAKQYLDAGASHVIVTSFVFSQGKIDSGRLQELVYKVGRKRVVLDLSCRRKDRKFFIVTDRWQQFSDVTVNPKTLRDLADSADEFLVHGVDVEGTRLGIDEELVHILANSPIPVTYAGGAKSLVDLDRIKHFGNGVVDVTIGSALDIFGGSLPYRDVVTWSKGQPRRRKWE